MVAATTLGMIAIQKDLPSMVVNYCQHPARVLDADQLLRFAPQGTAQRRTAVTSPAMEYLEESYHDSARYFDGLDPEYQDALRATYSAFGREPWVVEGLTVAAVRQHRAG